MYRGFLKAALGCLVLVTGPGFVEPALAHARFETASPAPGASLQTGPSSIRLHFNEPVQPVTMRIVDVTGKDLASGLPARAVDADVVLELPDALPTGSYIVSYRVLSADAHPIAASFDFRVGSASAQDEMAARAVAGGSEAPAARWAFQLVVARAAYMFGLLLTAGSVLFMLLVPSVGLRPYLERAVPAYALFTLLAALAYLQIGAADMLGSERVPDLGALRVAAGSSLGTSLGVAAVGLIMLIVGRSHHGGWLVPAIALLLLSRALTGHPVSREPGWLLMPVMMLHVACAAFWYAALPPLYLALVRLPPTTVADTVVRFSRVAMLAVAALLTAGLTMALVHVAGPSAVLGTWYGQLLVMKSTWFSVLLLIASWHKWSLTPRLLAGEVRAARRLRASIVVEGIIMTLVVLISVNVASTAPETLPARPVVAGIDGAFEVGLVSGPSGSKP
ncbi:MAG: copper resistance protein CopC [Gammaproteobacteria bacterium]